MPVWERVIPAEYIFRRFCRLPPAVPVCRSLPDLWRELGRLHIEEPQRSFWCIGGAELYAELLPYARELHLTRLKQSYEDDAFFPAFPGFALCSSDDRGACAFEHYVAADRLLKMKI